MTIAAAHFSFSASAFCRFVSNRSLVPFQPFTEKEVVYTVGELVQRRYEGEAWGDGFVTQLEPLKVTLSSTVSGLWGEGYAWADSYAWADVRKHPDATRDPEPEEEDKIAEMHANLPEPSPPEAVPDEQFPEINGPTPEMIDAAEGVKKKMLTVKSDTNDLFVFQNWIKANLARGDGAI